MCTSLDIVYDGWLDKEKESWNVSAWTEELADRLELLREMSVVKRLEASEKRKLAYDGNIK